MVMMTLHIYKKITTKNKKKKKAHVFPDLYGCTGLVASDAYITMFVYDILLTKKKKKKISW